LTHNQPCVTLNEVELNATQKGGEKVVDIEKLKTAIDDSGMTMVAISNKSGIDRATLYNRLKGVGEFTASEITGMADALRLKQREREEIFFAKEVE